MSFKRDQNQILCVNYIWVLECTNSCSNFPHLQKQKLRIGVISRNSVSYFILRRSSGRLRSSERFLIFLFQCLPTAPLLLGQQRDLAWAGKGLVGNIFWHFNRNLVRSLKLYSKKYHQDFKLFSSPSFHFPECRLLFQQTISTKQMHQVFNLTNL